MLPDGIPNPVDAAKRTDARDLQMRRYHKRVVWLAEYWDKLTRNQIQDALDINNARMCAMSKVIGRELVGKGPYVKSDTRTVGKTAADDLSTSETMGRGLAMFRRRASGAR